MTGRIKLHRSIKDRERYSDINTRLVFIHFLILANHDKSNRQWQVVEKWQFITWLNSLSEQIWLSVQQIRTVINKLKSTSEITIKSTSKNSIITLLQWDIYQNKECLATSTSTSTSTNHQQTINKPSTTDKNDKKEKNEKKTIKKSFWNFIKLTDIEYKKLCNDYLENNVLKKIDDMNIYCWSHWKKYKDYYLALRWWLNKDWLKKPQTDNEWIKLFYDIKKKWDRVIKYREELGKEKYDYYLDEAKVILVSESLNL